MVRVTRSLMALTTVLVLAFGSLGAGALPSLPHGAAAEDAAGPPQESSLLPDAKNEKEVLTDPAEDVRSFGFVGVGDAPATDLDADVDLVSLSVAETAEAFRIDLMHRAYTELSALAAQASPLDYQGCSISWRINGQDARSYGIDMWWDDPNDARALTAFAYRVVEYGDDWDYESLGIVESAMVGGDHYEFVFPKEWVTVGKADRPLKIDDKLTDFGFWCYKSLGLLMGYYDYNDESSGFFQVSMAAGTAEITLAIPSAGSGPVAVPADRQSRVDLVVQNLLDRKVIVNVTTQIVDASGQPLPGWTVQNAPNVEVKRYGNVPIGLIITPPEGVSHRDGGLLKVEALAIGSPQKATLSRTVHAVVSPGPANNVLHFHVAPGATQFCFPQCGGENLPTLLQADPVEFVMNVLETDPLYASTPVGENSGHAVLNAHWASAFLDLPLADPLRFDPDGILSLSVGLRNNAPVPVPMVFEAWIYSDEEFLGRVERTVEIGDTMQQYRFEMPPPQIERLPDGDTIEMYLRVYDDRMAGELTPWDVVWDPSQSSLTLPLLEVPRTQVEVTDGRALPSLAFANNTDDEEYIRPGHIQAFDLMLINEGLVDDVITARVLNVTPGWKVAFDPGTSFALKPGASAPLCMSVTAPQDAAPNSVVEFNVSATSKVDPKAVSSKQIKLFVADLESITGRTCSPLDPEEYVPPVKDTKESPGLPLVASLVLLAGLCGALRRRR